MRVAMLLSNPLGLDHRVQKEAWTLSSHGFSVKVFSWNHKKLPFDEKKWEAEQESLDYVSPRGSFNLLRAYLGLLRFQIWAFIKLMKSNFDVVHCHNFDTLVPGFFAGKIKRKKIVADLRDLYFTFPTLEKDSKILRIISDILKILEIWFVRRIDFIIVTTPKYYEYYSSITSVPIKVIYNFPEKDFKKDVQSVQENEDFVVSYIGNVRYADQLENLIKAAKNIPNVKVLVVGGGVKSHYLKNLYADEGHVSFAGEVPYSRVSDYYKISDCLYSVYSKADENTKYLIPVKVFEAMAFGIPVIVARGSYAGGFVEKHNIGLTIDDEVSEIEKSIVLLKNDKALYQEFRKNGLTLFKEKFNWETTSQELLALYNSFRMEANFIDYPQK